MGKSARRCFLRTGVLSVASLGVMRMVHGNEILAKDMQAPEYSDKPKSRIHNEVTQPPLRVMKTPAGTHFGLFEEKPPKPAPTLFILANGINEAGTPEGRMYMETGEELAKDGWLYAVLDPPCHGYDRKAGEPEGLVGWAYRVKAGEDLMGPSVRGYIDVLNYLTAEGYTDSARVAASGNSRGGYCALHFAAADSRLRVVTGTSPVTNVLALSEFTGVTQEQVAAISLDARADRLAGRPTWLSIGNDDWRVNTDDCISLSRKLVAATRRLKPDLKIVPVELVVGLSPDHHAIPDANLLEAAFLRRHIQ